MRIPTLFKPRDLSALEADVVALLASCGDGAYDEARTHARENRLGKVLDGNRPAGHLDKVRREIARRTGREIGIDTATRYLGDKA